MRWVVVVALLSCDGDPPEATKHAEAITAQAARDARESRETVERLEQDVEAMARRVDAAIDELFRGETSRAHVDAVFRDLLDLRERLGRELQRIDTATPPPPSTARDYHERVVSF